MVKKTFVDISDNDTSEIEKKLARHGHKEEPALQDLSENTNESEKKKIIIEAGKVVGKKVIERMRAMREYNLVPDLIPIKSGLEYEELQDLKNVLSMINRNIDRRTEKKITQESLIRTLLLEGIEKRLKKRID